MPGHDERKPSMLRPGTFALTVLLAALSAIGPLTTDMYLPSLPDIARLLNASTAQVQLTVSAYLLGFAFGQIFYGPLADRHGRKPVLLGAMALYCAASLACALSTSIEMLIAARALQALGGSGGIVLARAIVRDLYSGARAGRELSLIGAVMALAPVLAPLLGGVLQTGFGWRSVFFTLVGGGFFGAAIVWPLMPETLALRAAESVTPASMFKSYRVVARNPAYLAYLGLASTSFGGLFAWISGSSFVLQYLYGLTPFQFGVAFAVGSVGYMIGTTLCRAAGDAARHQPHARRRRGGDGRRRARHGDGGGAGLNLRRLLGVADGALSRRSRHRLAAGDRRRHDAVSGTGGGGLRAARLRAAECGGAVRRGGRSAARVKRLAARGLGGGDGLRDPWIMDRDARRARHAPPNSISFCCARRDYRAASCRGRSCVRSAYCGRIGWAPAAPAPCRRLPAHCC